MNCSTNIKVHFVKSHLDYFSENLALIPRHWSYARAQPGLMELPHDGRLLLGLKERKFRCSLAKITQKENFQVEDECNNVFLMQKIY